jgi:hypothetical protein
MKTLSIIILLGSLTALTIGGVLAVRPVLAEKTLNAAPKNAVVAAKPVAPLTGATGIASSSLSTDTMEFSTTFAVELEKDTESALAASQETASFESFVASVSTGNANQVTGIYVEGELAYSVTRQPNGDAAYVSGNPDEVTQFGMAAEYGSQAFLAHNYLAGATFFQLSEGQTITLVYGDGSTADFQIQSIRHFQALSPNSTQSSFVDLDNNEKLSASNLFYSMYNSDNSVVLQTCIANEGISTWGRLFVIAVPVS